MTSTSSTAPRKTSGTLAAEALVEAFGGMPGCSKRVTRRETPDGRVLTRVDFKIPVARRDEPQRQAHTRPAVGRSSRRSTNARTRGSRRVSRSTSRGGDSGDPDSAEGDPEALKLREAAAA